MITILVILLLLIKVITKKFKKRVEIMNEMKILEGTIIGITNKVSAKGQAYSIYKVVTLNGAKIDLFKWENNLSLLNKVAKFEVESTTKNDKQYLNITSLEVIQK